MLSLAAEAAFWALLSIPPLALALLGLVGYIAPLFGAHALANVESSIIDTAGRVFSERTIDRTVQPLVDNVLLRGRADVVSIGFVISLWSGSAAVGTYLRTITVAYDMPDLRPAWLSRLMGFVLFLAGIALGIVLLPALVVGPHAIAELAPGPVRPAVSTTVAVIYWPAIVVVSVVALATLYKVAVPVVAPWHRGLPGAVLAMGLWVAGSVALRAYLTVSSAGATRSSTLGAPIAVLLFLYVTAFAVLVGAELNSEIDRRWPIDATSAGRIRQLLRSSANS